MPKGKHKPNNINNDIDFWENELGYNNNQKYNNPRPEVVPYPTKGAGIKNIGYLQDYGKYLNLGEDEYNWDGTLDENFNDVPFQPNIREQNLNDYYNINGEGIMDDPIAKHNMGLLDRDMSPYQKFDWGKAGKYGLGALGLGGAMYGLYRLINYLRNRNKPAAPAVPASNVVQPPVSPARSNKFRNRNKFKRKI